MTDEIFIMCIKYLHVDVVDRLRYQDIISGVVSCQLLIFSGRGSGVAGAGAVMEAGGEHGEETRAGHSNK